MGAFFGLDIPRLRRPNLGSLPKPRLGRGRRRSHRRSIHRVMNQFHDTPSSKQRGKIVEGESQPRITDFKGSGRSLMLR